jgi:putative ABC transport system permease protein
MLMIYNAQTTVSNSRPSDAGYNLLINTTTNGDDNAAAQMILQGASDLYRASRVRGSMNGEPIMIEGRSADDLHTDVSFSGEWHEDQSVALLPQNYDEQYDVGDNLTLHADEREQTVTLVGFYAPFSGDSITGGTTAIIVPRQVAQALGGERTQVLVVGSLPVETLDAATTAIGEALPDALVFSRADLNDWLATTFQSLFTFAVSVAGLAFVAGAVLIANAAGLTVVERRSEIGIFKAVGYTSSHVLRLLLSEYGFLGVLAGVFGLIAVIIVVMLINISLPGAELMIEPVITGGMLLFSVTIAILSAGVVAWQPTRVRPLDVLRYE